MVNSKINIAFLLDTIETPQAGTEKQLLLLLQHLDRDRFAPHIITLRSSKWLESTTLPFPVIDLGMERLSLRGFLPSYQCFAAYCRENEIGIVQTFFRDANLFGTFSARMAGIPVLVSARRSLGRGHWHTPGWLLILRALRAWTTRYVSNSQMVADYTIAVEGVPAEQVVTIHNGLDFAPFARITPELRLRQRARLGVGESEALVGLVANWRPVKNVPLFLTIAARIASVHRHVRFIVIGKDAPDGAVAAAAAEFRPRGNLIFAGPQDDLIPYLAAMDIGTLCSRAESFSNSIMEYMAAGIPCVVSNVGGNVEALGGIGGAAFRSDNADEFAEKVMRYVTDQELRRRTGDAAAIFARTNYDHRIYVARYAELYESLFTQYCC